MGVVSKEALRPLARWHIIHEICTCSVMGVRRARGGVGGRGGALASNDPSFPK